MTASDPPATAAAAAAASGPILLLVDDEPSVLSALRRLFRPHGYQVLQATSGADALALLSEQPVDLVISDMRMPAMDGASLLEAVRLRQPDTVRILLTGYADIGSTVAAINRGEIHRYIAKPWDDQDMLLVVRDALARRGLEQQNAQLLALTQSQNQQLRELNLSLEARVSARTAELEQVNQMLNAAYAEVSSNFTLSVTVLSGLLEMRQDGIAGHSRRVSLLAKRMAAHLQLDSRAQEDVFLAALLHDIGKIGFTDAMLRKPISTYSSDELARYRQHPLDGEAALMPLAQLHGVARIVRQHHERFDGHGYPDALAGDAICMGARIVAVASDYDGLLNGSLAQQRFSRDATCQALRAGGATRYDHRVVAALLAVLSEIDAEAVAETQVEIRNLRPGMVLTKDLLSPKGAILLAAGYVFEARVIRQVGEFATREGLRVALHVLSSSIPSDSGSAAATPAAPNTRSASATKPLATT